MLNNSVDRETLYYIIGSPHKIFNKLSLLIFHLPIIRYQFTNLYKGKEIFNFFFKVQNNKCERCGLTISICIYLQFTLILKMYNSDIIITKTNTV